MALKIERSDCTQSTSKPCVFYSLQGFVFISIFTLVLIFVIWRVFPPTCVHIHIHYAIWFYIYIYIPLFIYIYTHVHLYLQSEYCLYLLYFYSLHTYINIIHHSFHIIYPRRPTNSPLRTEITNHALRKTLSSGFSPKPSLSELDYDLLKTLCGCSCVRSTMYQTCFRIIESQTQYLWPRRTCSSRRA